MIKYLTYILLVVIEFIGNNMDKHKLRIFSSFFSSNMVTLNVGIFNRFDE